MSEATDAGKVLGMIGLGAMGAPICRRLMAAGHQMAVFDVDVAAAPAWRAEGARFAASLEEVAGRARIVLLSLPGPAEVEAVTAGPGGLLSAARPGDVIVDLSTNAYATVRAMSEAAVKVGVHFVDAPVSGGVAGAVKGRLAVMAGGEAAVIARIEPILAAFAARVFHAGPAGMGTMAKLVNNQIFLTAATAVQEGFVLAAKAGFDSRQLLEILEASSAAGYVRMAPLFLNRAFDEVMFRLGLAHKDLSLALRSADDLGVPMPQTRAALATYQDAIDKGLGEKVFYATLAALEANAGTQVAKPGPAP
jgi:3-hydroxyisobutyrate dehydrogenase-like beta-hydroxyacid dehydrogenase